MLSSRPNTDTRRSAASNPLRRPSAGRRWTDRRRAVGEPERSLASLALVLALVVLSPALAAARPLRLAPATPTTAADPRALLPTYRLLSYYGFPTNNRMGILGAYDPDTLLAKLQDQAAAYQDADPSRPIMPVFEVIASVAQHDPGSDGLYIVHTAPDVLNKYADFTAQHGIQLMLDVQIGRSTVKDEIHAIRPWLERPNVHVALDPEFAIAPGQTPGEDLGGIDGSDVTYAQNALARLTKKLNLPPKVLLVHQFRDSMVRNKDQVKPVPGVQLVFNADGFGDPETKTKVYDILIRDEPVQYAGIKLFYDQDQPLMSPQDIVALTPSPDVVIYQ